MLATVAGIEGRSPIGIIRLNSFANAERCKLACIDDMHWEPAANRASRRVNLQKQSVTAARSKATTLSTSVRAHATPLHHTPQVPQVRH